MNTLFSIGSADAIEAYQNRERWEYQCKAVNPALTTEQLRTYDTSAAQYAMTTLYPNTAVVAHCRRLALEALKRGEPLPNDAQTAINDERRRAMLRWVS